MRWPVRERRKEAGVISRGFELHLAWKMTATGSSDLRRSPWNAVRLWQSAASVR